jgi:rRNA processing protein Gar1
LFFTVQSLPPPEKIELEITDQHVLEQIGIFQHAVDVYVVVEGLKFVPAIDMDTILCSDERKVLGKVEEVFGPVVHPKYTVRFASQAEIPKLKEVCPNYLFNFSRALQFTELNKC